VDSTSITASWVWSQATAAGAGRPNSLAVTLAKKYQDASREVEFANPLMLVLSNALCCAGAAGVVASPSRLLPRRLCKRCAESQQVLTLSTRS
jgi:hypothetical protein